MAPEDPKTTPDATPGTSEAQDPATVATHLGVTEAYARFQNAIERMDGGLVGDLFTGKAVFVTADATALEGRAAIAAGFNELFRGTQERGMRLRLEVHVDDRVARDNVVHDQGSYALHVRIGTAELPFKKGRFLAVFRRHDRSGDYRMDTASVFPLLRTFRPTSGVH